MRKSVLVPAVLALIFFLFASAMPRKAQAAYTDGLIISAYVAGGVAVIGIIAILLAPRDEPDFLEFVPPDERSTDLTEPGFRFGPACRMPDGTVATVCW